MSEITLTEEQIKAIADQVKLDESHITRIAERAAEVALQKVYAEVGKSVVKKLIWLIGAVAIGLALWLSKSGPLPKEL